MPGDEREMGQRLGVADQGGPSVDATLERSRGHVQRFCLTPLEPVHKRGLLTRDIVRRQLVDRHEETSSRGSLGEGGPQRPHRRRTAVHGHVCAIRPNRGGRELDAVEDEMGSVSEQQRVLGCRRLALHAVGDDDRSSASLSNGPHLATGGEAGAAVAQKTGRFDEI